MLYFYHGTAKSRFLWYNSFMLQILLFIVIVFLMIPVILKVTIFLWLSYEVLFTSIINTLTLA